MYPYSMFAGSGMPPAAPYPGSSLLDPNAGRWAGLSQGLLSAGGAMLAGGDPRYPQPFSQALGRGFLGFGQGLQQGQEAWRRNALADSTIQYQGAEMDALKTKTDLANAQIAARQRIAAGLMGYPTAQGGGAGPGSQVAQAGGPASDATSAGPTWDQYLSAALQSMAAGDNEGAGRYLEIAKAMPGYDAQKARALIDVKVEEQQALMPGKVQEAGQTAGAEAGARLPYQKNLAGYEFGLTFGREKTLAGIRAQLEIDTAGPKAAAVAAAQAGSPTQVNLNVEKLRDDFRSDKNVINYQTVIPIFESMKDAVNRPGGAADLNLVYGMAKILDPASVVREGETWMVRDTSNLPQEIQGLIGKVTSGQRLPTELRQTLVAEAASRVTALKQANDVAADFYRAQAKTIGVDPGRIVYDITPPKRSGAGQPAAPLSDDDLVKGGALMATRDQLLKALRAADAAGNKEDATTLARSIQAMDAQGAQPSADPFPSTTATRSIGYFGKGFGDSAAETIGAVPDAINWLYRKAGIDKALGVETPPPGFYSGKIKQGLGYLGMGGPKTPPEGWLERGSYGAGRGVADAASVAIPAAAVARGARAGSLAGRVATGLAAQPAAQAAAGAAGGAVGEATDNPLLGLAASLGVPFSVAAARRVVSPVVNRLTPEAQRLARVAEAEGIRLRPGQATGSRPLKTTESVLGTLPLSSGMSQTIDQTQREAFNAAVLRRAGIQANAATPDILNEAHVRLGREFQRLSANTTVNLNRAFLTDLQDTVAHYSAKLPSQQRAVFHNYVNDILNSGNTMPGRTYQVTRSDLGRHAKTVVNTDPMLSRALSELQDALDNAAGRSIPPQMRDAWQEARRQYGNLRIVDRAMASPSADAASGNIPPAQIWGGVKAQRGDVGLARGRGDLNDLSRVGQLFIKQQIPNSGTPERTAITRLMTGGLPLMGALVGGAPGALAGMGAAGVGLLMPPAVQAFMNSAAGRQWLVNQAAHGAGGPRTTAGLLSAIATGRAKNEALNPYSLP